MSRIRFSLEDDDGDKLNIEKLKELEEGGEGSTILNKLKIKSLEEELDDKAASDEDEPSDTSTDEVPSDDVVDTSDETNADDVVEDDMPEEIPNDKPTEKDDEASDEKKDDDSTTDDDSGSDKKEEESVPDTKTDEPKKEPEVSKESISIVIDVRDDYIKRITSRLHGYSLEAEDAPVFLSSINTSNVQDQSNEFIKTQVAEIKRIHDKLREMTQYVDSNAGTSSALNTSITELRTEFKGFPTNLLPLRSITDKKTIAILASRSEFNKANLINSFANAKDTFNHSFKTLSSAMEQLALLISSIRHDTKQSVNTLEPLFISPNLFSKGDSGIEHIDKYALNASIPGYIELFFNIPAPSKTNSLETLNNLKVSTIGVGSVKDTSLVTSIEPLAANEIETFISHLDKNMVTIRANRTLIDDKSTVYISIENIAKEYDAAMERIKSNQHMFSKSMVDLSIMLIYMNKLYIDMMETMLEVEVVLTSAIKTYIEASLKCYV